MKNDPLGTQPPFVSGQRSPTLQTLARSERFGDLKKLLRGIWVDHLPQLVNIHRLKTYRIETLGQLGRPIDGRRLCQESQAGKSAIAWRLKEILSEERIAQGLEPNPYQVVIITIQRGMTIKNFLLASLNKLKDGMLKLEFERSKASKSETIQTLEERFAEWVLKLGVELVFIEEVQRLVGDRQDAKRVTEQFQTMLDNGVAALVLMGTELAEPLFTSNKELRPRLGTPLELLPVPGTNDDDAKMLQDFCQSYDERLVSKGVFKLRSNLDEPEVVEPLSLVTGGHIGRVARLFREAAIGAVERGADFVELYDLSNATRGYGIENEWTQTDPFSK